MSNRTKITLIALSAFIVVVSLLTVVQTCRQIRKIEQKVDDKFDRLTPPVIIPKYDSATQSRVDSIEMHRQMSHNHVDNLYDNQLQDVLDSLYNATR